MKSIKKLSLVVMALVMSVGLASAQVGIQAGYDMSKNASNSNDDAMNGFHVGPVFNMDIQGPISLQYGLLYNYLTSSKEGTILGIKGKSKVTAHRLDLPVRVAASFPFGNGMKAFIFGGPNFNYAISQAAEAGVSVGNSEALKTDTDNIYKMKDAKGDKVYSPFDVQLGVGAGFQFNNFGVKVSYDWGMLDRNKLDNLEWKNNDLKVGLFYNF